jgi:RNA polymerase sigma-70 factor (ECF subfamily)
MSVLPTCVHGMPSIMPGVLRCPRAFHFFGEEGIDSQSPRYRPGSREDFDRLYTVTYQRVFGTVLTLLRDRAAAEDCAQETYLRAFRAWASWKPSAPAEAWLHRIAINLAISWRRRERLREVGELIRRFGAPEQSETPDLALRNDLLRELRALPPRQAAALVLRHYHGYSNRDIAHALGIPERTVASRLIRARSQLQRRLTEAREWRTALATGVPSDE